jgi:nitric oxide reductase large subunit
MKENQLDHIGDHKGRPFISRENLWALVLFLIIILLVILTASQSPAWIYQGF